MKCLINYHRSSPEGEEYELFNSTEEFVTAYPIFKSLFEQQDYHNEVTVTVDLPDDPAVIKIKMKVF